MEVLLILIATVIIVFVIHQSSSATKLKKARALMAKGDFYEAQEILETIFSKQPDAPSELAKCKLKIGLNLLQRNVNQALSEFQQILELDKRLPPSSNKEQFNKVKAIASLQVCKLKYDKVNELKSIRERISHVEESLKYIDNAAKIGVEKEYSALRVNHLQKLSEQYFSLGKDSERNSNFEEADDKYMIAKNYASQCSDKKASANATVRQGICYLKRGLDIDERVLSEITYADDKYKVDFYFRLAVRMLDLQKYKESEEIIANHLPLNSTEIQQLNEIIQAEKVRRAALQIESINLALDKLYEQSFPIEDVISLYGRLDEQIDLLKYVLPEHYKKVIQLKPSLLNRILTHCISEKQFAQAINFIQKFPSFWESPELLQNLGICCYNFASQGNLTEKNYRTIISSWLTAAYSDVVMLKSIESTVWDDAYSFSLIEAVGSKYSQYDDLPDNVNYGELSDTNISIGATQRELISRFETLLQGKIEDTSLIRKVDAFYNSEKEAIEKIISIIPSQVFFATPYFAKVFGISDSIIKELDTDYIEYSDEESLKAGVPYIKNNTNSHVTEYAFVKQNIERVIELISLENLDELKKLFTERFKILKSKFDSLDSLFEDSIFDQISSKIEEDDENEIIIHIMDECIQLANSGNKLKYLYSKYVTNYCISKVNAGELTNIDALLLMKRAYMYTPDSSRICKNLVTLIRFNLLDTINTVEGATSYHKRIKPILDQLYSNRSITFIQSSSELGVERTKILMEMKRAGIDVSILEQERFTHLQNLTPQGLILSMVLSEFKRFSPN
jgi:hypothetical protein